MKIHAFLIQVLLLLGFMGRAMSAQIGSLSDYPACRVSITHWEAGAWQSMKATWGIDDRITGKNVPLLRATTNKEKKNLATVDLDERGRDSIFSAAKSAVAKFGVPASTLERNVQGDGFTIEIGSPYDPLTLVFPKRDPARWNTALLLWREMRSRFDGDTQASLSDPEPLGVTKGKDDYTGMASIREYTVLKGYLTRYMDKGSSYEFLHFDWSRDANGEISFSASWDPRSGDRLKANPDVKHIGTLFGQVQKMISKYRLPPSSMYMTKGRETVARDYDALKLTIKTGGVYGEHTWTFYEKDRQQWSEAMLLWKSCRELFPDGDRGKISEP